MREKNPDLLLLFKAPTTVRCWDDDADAVAEELGLKVTQVDGMMCCLFPTKDLDANVALLLKANLRVGICEPVKGGVGCTEAKAGEPAANGKKGSARKKATAK